MLLIGQILVLCGVGGIVWEGSVGSVAGIGFPLPEEDDAAVDEWDPETQAGRIRRLKEMFGVEDLR